MVDLVCGSRYNKSGGTFRRFRLFSMGYGIMAKNTNAKANKTANKTSAINGAVVHAVSPDQQAISELTLMVQKLMKEISELKAAKVPPVGPAYPTPACFERSRTGTLARILRGQTYWIGGYCEQMDMEAPQ